MDLWVCIHIVSLIWVNGFSIILIFEPMIKGMCGRQPPSSALPQSESYRLEFSFTPLIKKANYYDQWFGKNMTKLYHSQD